MKNVLLIGMDFYIYEEAMVKKLSSRYHVCHYADRKDFFIDHFHIPVSGSRRRQMIRNHQKKILQAVKGKTFEYVLVLVGRYLERSFLDALRQQSPDGVFVLYLWDDVKRVENFAAVRDFYDRIITFDPEDAAAYGFDFMPLMYLNRREASCTKVRDLYSVMYLHTDRERIAEKVIQKYPELSCEVYFKCPLAVALKNRRRAAAGQNGKSRIVYQKATVGYQKLTEDMLASGAVLDIQFPSQVGLTMRTFDVMSVGRKLITTNPSVRYYDFYNPRNVAVIDREDPVIPSDFLDTPCEPLPAHIMDKYSMDHWLKMIFEDGHDRYLTEGNPYGL